MTRKDFQLIAECLNVCMPTHLNDPIYDDIIDEFCRHLPESNAAFNPEFFRKAATKKR